MSLKAELLAVGSELLTPPRQDTNGAYLAAKLAEAGIQVGARVMVADEPELLASAFRAALARAELVVATGGLGPTADDLTRPAAAAALGRELVRDRRLVAELEARFARYGRKMAASNRQQADVIAGAVLLSNSRGTAPGQYVEAGDRLLVLLPGPPREMEPMFEEQVLPLVRERSGGTVHRTRVLRVASMSESDVEELVGPLYRDCPNPRTTVLSSPGLVEIHLTAEAPQAGAAAELVETLAGSMRARLGNRIFSEDGRQLHEVVAGLLRERQLTLALAESCTGGGLAECLTRVPGSSAYLERGFVTYSNRSKVEELGVAAELIEEQGAVSAEVAAAMAEGARQRAGAQLGLGITGIAGPGGGSADKPVGLVFLALAGTLGARTRRALFAGDRSRVREQACQAALEMLRKALLEGGVSSTAGGESAVEGGRQ